MATPLTAPALPTDTLAEFEAKLQAARVAARENVDRSDPLPEIWVGRRLAYLGRFDEAIEHYSTLLERHPQESRILRHRGHRYISLRQLDAAIADLTRAAELERGRADRVEPDGLPSDLDEALTSFERCRELSANDDMLVATAHWLHMIQRRLGRDEANAALCRALDRPLEILENDGYQTLLELYCGSVEWDDSALDLSNDAIAYGVARWLRDRDAPEAERLYRQILDRAPSYSFGAIAADELIGRQRVAW
jgi:tetratricopeptide (TPR) repeat protein